MSDVKEFTPDDFSIKNPQKLNDKYKNTIALVKFYRNDCIHCVNSKPEFEKLATTLKDDPKYVIAEIDCVKYMDSDLKFLQRNRGNRFGFKIDGYPTFIIFVNTLYFETYQSGRDLNSYLNTLANIQTS